MTQNRTTPPFTPTQEPDGATPAADAGCFPVRAHFVRVEGGDEEKCLAGKVDDVSEILEPGRPTERPDRYPSSSGAGPSSERGSR